MEGTYPLQGLKVVELSTAIAVPMTARMLSSYGAEVIKVESPQGDILRFMVAGQMKKSVTEKNPAFDYINTGKKLIALDLKSDEGMKIFLELLAEADVFLSNVRMPSLVKMGLDYATLKEKFPKLIMGHLSGYGLKGPEAEAPGFDITAFWMRSGGATDNIEPGAQALFPAFGFGDIVSSNSLLAGVLMALYARETTGKGDFVTTSLYANGIWCNSSSIIQAQGDEGKVYPASHYDTWDPFSFQYLCADDRWIAVMEKNYSKDKSTFAQIFDMPELLTDPDLASLETMARSGKGRAVVKKLEEIMLTKTSEEWSQIFDDHDVANAIAQHFYEVPEDEQALVNDYFTESSYFAHDYAIPNPPIQFEAGKRKDYEQTGAVGKDTTAVLLELGYSEAEIQQLKEEKIIVE